MKNALLISFLLFTIRFVQAQNVGVGSTTPTSRLEIKGAVDSDTLFQVKTSTNISRLTLLNNGNLGIGEISPAVKLHVVGTSELLRLVTPSHGTIYFGADANEPWLGTSSNHNLRLTTNGVANWVLQTDGNFKFNGADDGLIFYGGGEKIIGTSGYGIQFQTSGGTPRATITNSGIMAVGDFAPHADYGKLQVDGDASIGKLNTGSGSAGYGNRLFFVGGPNFAGNSQNTDELFVARYNLASDASELRVQIGDNFESDNQALVDKFAVGANNNGINTFVPRLTVTSDGKVGINNNSPAYNLDVVGNMTATIFYDKDNTGYYVDPSGTSNFNVINAVGGGETVGSISNVHAVGMYQHHDGNKGFNPNTWHQVVLGDNGGWGTNYNRMYLRRGDNSYGNEIRVAFADATSSSRKLKEDISPIAESRNEEFLNELLNIDLVTYRFINDPFGKKDFTHVGFIAEDLPTNLQTPNKDGLELGDAFAYTIAALKALKKENDELKNKINSFDNMKAELEQLKSYIYSEAKK
jgi:hypothetical protein